MASLVVASKIQVKSVQIVKTGKKLYLNEQFADVHFKFIDVEGQCESIPAHKTVLVGASEVFATMFDGRWKEQVEVEIDDASPDEFKEFLQFPYSDEFEVTLANIPKIMYLAKKYQMNECLAACEQSLQQYIELDDVCTGLEIAITLDRDELKQQYMEMIHEDTAAVFGTDAFLNCSQATLKLILESGKISCDESKVFNACIDWAKAKCRQSGAVQPTGSDLKRQLGDCLHLIQFALMSPEQMSDCVVDYDGLFDNNELMELCSIHSKKRTSKTFKSVKRHRPKWSDDTALQIWRVRGKSICYELKSSLVSITFKVLRRVYFGAISTSRLFSTFGITQVKGKLSIFETEAAAGTKVQTMLLTQPICFSVHGFGTPFNYTKHNYTKLNEMVEINPSNEYKLVIEFDDFGTQKSVIINACCEKEMDGSGILINLRDPLDNHLIAGMYFQDARCYH